MSDSETSAIIDLQQKLRIRFAELEVPAGAMRNNLERHLAHIAVLGRNFAEHTLPLFLSVSADHKDTLVRLAHSIKCDLDELRDALTDIEHDLESLLANLSEKTGS